MKTLCTAFAQIAAVRRARDYAVRWATADAAALDAALETLTRLAEDEGLAPRRAPPQHSPAGGWSL